MRHPVLSLSVLTLAMAMALSARAGHEQVIEIEKDLPQRPDRIRMDLEQDVPDLPADTGGWLRSLPGVSGKRLGGHGIDPVVRGQAENRINVLLDGAYVYGGCPNRMDPPASYAPLWSYDSLTLVKGAQTVRYGGGGSGGTLSLERRTPRFEEAGGRLKAEAGYAGNGNRRELAADGALGNEQGYLRLVAGYTRADNYKDGDGEEVPSALTERGANLMLGYTPSADSRLELGIEAIRGEDILYAGRMDAPTANNDVVRLKFEQAHLAGPFVDLEAELYHAKVYHLMDNYSLRELTAPMKMRVPSDSVTQGGRLGFGLAKGDTRWHFGLDYQHNNRDAIRYTGASADQVNSYMWPDVTLAQTGLFAEVEHPLGQLQRLMGGLRLDWVSAEAGRATQDPPGMSMSPNQLYSLYYGREAGKHDETNLGGFLRYERDLRSSPLTWSAGLSRSVRTADATERFMAANGMSPDSRWVGNPAIAAEKHHQLELGLALEPVGWELALSAYYDAVRDFILRDRAHAQAGILQNDNATIYRNIDALLYGAELSMTHRWAGAWRSRFTLATVYGENTTDDRPLAQIPPLSFSLDLGYEAIRWSFTGRVRGAARQNRVDDDPNTGSGLDAGQTPGWAVLDLYGAYRFARGFQLRYGIDNAFDRRYAEHLNQANAFDPVQVQINEPGRSLWLKLTAAL